MEFLFCCLCIMLLSFAIAEVLLVLVVNSLQELLFAIRTAYLCSLLAMLYSSQWCPPFFRTRWWHLRALCLLSSSSDVHHVSLWLSVMVRFGQAMSKAEVIRLYSLLSSDSIVWLSHVGGGNLPIEVLTLSKRGSSWPFLGAGLQ